MNDDQMIVGARVRVCRDIVIGEVGGRGGYLAEMPVGKLGTVERLPVGLDHLTDARFMVRFDEPAGYFGPPDAGPITGVIVWKACVPECTAEDFELLEG